MLEGLIAVEAALRADSRPVFRIYADTAKLPRGFGRLRALALDRGVPIELCTRAEVESFAAGRHHGGIVATAGDRRLCSLDDLLLPADVPFLVLLDGVEDPFNFGQALRSIYAAGATGVILRPRNWMSAAAVVARASAGASELIPSSVVESVSMAAEFCLRRGLSLVALDRRAHVSLYDVDLTIPLLLVLGGEWRGVTRSFRRSDHLAVRIPYRRADARSLGTAASAAVAAFEVARQRRKSILQMPGQGERHGARKR